jgi:hypothetical protein
MSRKTQYRLAGFLLVTIEAVGFVVVPFGGMYFATDNGTLLACLLIGVFGAGLTLSTLVDVIENW